VGFARWILELKNGTKLFEGELVTNLIHSVTLVLHGCTSGLGCSKEHFHHLGVRSILALSLYIKARVQRTSYKDHENAVLNNLAQEKMGHWL
jgi:hypothetical protein